MIPKTVRVGGAAILLGGALSLAALRWQAGATRDGVKFTEVARAAGITYRWETPGKSPRNILQTMGGGCAFLDYNNDGNLDILLIGPRLALYKGDGHGHFTDVTREAGLDRLSGSFQGCAVGDYDNDGYDDLYLSAYRGGILLHNEGGKRFQDVTTAAGIAPQPWGTSCTFVDVDGDGKLDLYICNYVVFGPDTQPQLCNFAGTMDACGPTYYKPEYGALYHNEGGGKFRDITTAWIGSRPKGRSWVGQGASGKALGVAAADFDGSGHQSLAVANDESPGDLLCNLGLKFQNIGIASGVAFGPDGNVHGGMGIDWGDYDNDGRLDLAVATFTHEPKSVYHNRGGHVFSDDAARLGIATQTAPYVAFGVKWLDYDNDGFLDLIFANGHTQDNASQIDRTESYRQPTQLFHNLQGKRFEDVSAQAGPGLQQEIVGRGLAVGDYDNDGRIDVLIVDGAGAPLLLHNETVPVGHWLLLKLIGTKSNRDGIGALVTVEAGGKTLQRRCATDGSYLSASDGRVHVGIGAATSATVRMQWPSGGTDVYRNVPIDRPVTLREGDSA